MAFVEAISAVTTGSNPIVFSGLNSGDALVVIYLDKEDVAFTLTPPTGHGFTSAILRTTEQAFQVYRKVAGVAGQTDTASVTFTLTGSGAGGVLYGVRISGVNIDDPYDDDVDYTQGSSTTPSCPSIDITADDAQVLFVAINQFSANNPTSPSQGSAVGSQVDESNRFASSLVTKNAGTSGTCTWSGMGIAATGISLAFNAPISYTAELEGYRWRNDDGSEITATWKASQDTGVTVAPAQRVRLRALVNYTGDPGAVQHTLQVRRVGDSAANWETVN